MKRLCLLLIILFGLALVPVPAFASGELQSGQTLVVRFYAKDNLAKTLTVTPGGQAVWSVKDEALVSKITSVTAFLVSGENEAPIIAGYTPRVGSHEFRIGPDDVLDINVWDNQQLTKTLTVRPDGVISLPLVGDVQAAGKTAGGLKKELEKKLGQYVDKPEVTVTLNAIHSYKVFVQGQVTRPGAYPITGTSTITHAISLAGGFTPFAAPNSIVILREGGLKTEKIRVRYKRIIAGKAQDILVMPGDTIVVP